jgi:hypothetical protein
VIIPALVFILSNAQVSWQIITRYHQWGAGYTSAAWQRSTTLQALQALPPDIPVITNETAAVLLLADRPAYDFCGPTYDPNWPCIQLGEFRYGDLPGDETQRIFREEEAALVIFYPYCARREQAWSAGTLAQLESLTQGLLIHLSSCDGAIFFYPAP